MADKPGLDAAYALHSPDDSRRLYADWAETYDTEFAKATGFQVPTEVARVFRESGGEGPVLDIGAGTGAVGEALARQKFDIFARHITDLQLHEVANYTANADPAHAGDRSLIAAFRKL
ncbi:hypothetical protein [Tranquillimonas alkanivorans]|uniref:Methyltransferase domain-containing protein n=1 Tax=Tranquillimonas alkanivorans TaxID=441119 RepID=A0A1I5U487_9RHOB|nr:hypothetical protein [Tranquillimonas alkanivorans]SFP90089.1 hypothetical protein SAMN04488047_11747 [Tranquillimonas alkanivorans]